MENKEKKYKEWLSGKLSPSRLAHVASVVKEAEYLAKLYGADCEKCRVAALLHDAAKELSLEEMKSLYQELPSPALPEIDMEQGEILHGFAAAALVKKELGIVDAEILEAIQYHTIGEKNLSLVAEIVYIADAIEETRNYPSVQNIREEVHKNLHRGILIELQHKATYFASMGVVLHPKTLEWKRSLEEESL